MSDLERKHYNNRRFLLSSGATMIVVFAIVVVPLFFCYLPSRQHCLSSSLCFPAVHARTALFSQHEYFIFRSATEFAPEPCRLKVKPLHYLRSSSSGSLPVITLKRASSSFIPSPAIISMRSSCNSRLRCSSVSSGRSSSIF